MKSVQKVIDGNEAAALVAYKVSEVCAIYPITPSSTMGELADQWSAQGKKNIWGTVPSVAEMQSEGGAIGAAHGALATGALTTTFTASQGLLLMIPNLFKIAGELTPAVFHVAARAVATQALSIFGEHSDMMAIRSCGLALLCSDSVQEAQDMALIAHASTLKARIPFIHFFDGFRTSHELNKANLIDDDVIRAMIDEELVFAHRARALSPDHPTIRGTAQNPDVYFQAREACNPYYNAVPGIVEEYMERFATLTGRKYKLFDYVGHPQAERIIVSMGSSGETVTAAVEELVKQGEKVGVLRVHLFRPFSFKHFLKAIPATVKSIAVIDRTKEPGAPGEPLYQDVVSAYVEGLADDPALARPMPRIVGGRYGLSSKDFTPAMAKAILDELKNARPKTHFTIGINDDVTGSSIDYDPNWAIMGEEVKQCLFYGLGADGTVGANHNTIKIIGEETDMYAQGYFVYDSKKSGGRTTSHLRFGPNPIKAPYLIQKANFLGVHQFQFFRQFDVLGPAAQGATVLINTPYSADEVWDKLPANVQKQMIEKKLRVYVVDAYSVARAAGMGNRINTIMQTCFFAIAKVIPSEVAIKSIKDSIYKSYIKKGEAVVAKNNAAVDQAIANMFEMKVPAEVTAGIEAGIELPADASDFVRNFTQALIEDRGESLPVSMMPADGTFPTATSKYEKRNISQIVPSWESDMCIECGNCSFVCPHACIRAKFYPDSALEDAPDGFKSAKLRGRGFPDQRYTLHISLEDCTGCGLCVEACPVIKGEGKEQKRAINMTDKDPIFDQEKKNGEFFEKIPYNKRPLVNFSTVRGIQYTQPLFEFSGACAGCGETPYLKLLSQLFGERLMVANATGCSSIYGGNLPTTPWAKNDEGRGPAWANSLFEDNAEFGLGYRLTLDKHNQLARELLTELAPRVGENLAKDILEAKQETEMQIFAQRQRIGALKEQLQSMNDSRAKNLLSLADNLLRRSVWIVGGDGWAYDIGYGGLDHIIASGRNVNILVMDTEVYSNTGGQASKATPLGAVAKFAAGGKSVGKKDLAMAAMAYGHAYVARISFGANPQQALRAFREAEAYEGPSIIICYAHCIAHGINMVNGLKQQQLAVRSGYWPLLRFNPDLADVGRNPLTIDSTRGTIPLKEYAYNENRYKMLVKSDPTRAAMLMEQAQKDVNDRWALYEVLANRYEQQLAGAKTAPVA
ncbi:MAG: pyruvate:ferredoxin (flavodoxin) oxidoreductase [Opitutales bacterium]|nr:pyruvate:ferredoxin (flavodoxin) oxidoreductase [Opitutales bacterium]